MKPLLAVALFNLAVALPAHARLLKLPYLQGLTDSSVIICWEQSAPAPGRVDYGLTPDLEFSVWDTAPLTLHQVPLSGLLPDTTYYYRVIAGPDTAGINQFHTPSVHRSSFQLIVYGDCRTDSAAHQSVVNRMLSLTPPPVLLLNSGDLTEDGSDSCYQLFFNITARLLSRNCLFPVLGNHDIRNLENYLRFFVLPGNERYYSFRCGNSLFIMLDNYSEFQPGSAQYEWLTQTLESARHQPDIRHRFVLFHEPPYTTSQAHPGNEQVQRFLCPLFEQYRITGVFSGHIHAYEHSLVNGIHYFTTGGGGAPLHTRWYEPAPWTVYREAVHHFLLVDVNGDTVLIRGIRTDGSEFDRTRIFSAQGVNAAGRENPLSTALRFANPGTKVVTIEIATPGPAAIIIYDLAGKREALFSVPAGRNHHTITWQPPRPGCYFLMLRTPEQFRSRRLTVY